MDIQWRFSVEPLLKEHDRQAVEVFCYAEVKRPDAVTTRLQGLADHWLVTVGLSDDELAERIRADGIDILVDLAGHTANNRLRVFARKPAPVQVTWLGYPNTTGLEAIDYRLVDAVTDPVGEADAWASETLVRLEGGFLCYGALKDAPEPAVPPCLKTGTVTFGSFNNPAKVSAATFDAWATLLSRLTPSAPVTEGKTLRRRRYPRVVPGPFGRTWCGGGAGRTRGLAARTPPHHLALYHQVDIALDPFPYNGTTTTCEALWMGVPVVTLRGDRHAGRVGASLLSQIGLTDLIANSVEEYVEIAVSACRQSATPGRATPLVAPAHGSVAIVRRACFRSQNGSRVSHDVAALVYENFDAIPQFVKNSLLPTGISSSENISSTTTHRMALSHSVGFIPQPATGRLAMVLLQLRQRPHFRGQ